MKVQKLKDLEVLLYSGVNVKEEDEEKVIRDFTTAKERIWLYTPWLSVQIFRMDMVFCFDAREESLSRFRYKKIMILFP